MIKFLFRLWSDRFQTFSFKQLHFHQRNLQVKQIFTFQVTNLFRLTTDYRGVICRRKEKIFASVLGGEFGFGFWFCFPLGPLHGYP